MYSFKLLHILFAASVCSAFHSDCVTTAVTSNRTFTTLLYRADAESRRAVSPTTTVTSPQAAAGAPDSHRAARRDPRSVTESSGRIFPVQTSRVPHRFCHFPLWSIRKAVVSAGGGVGSGAETCLVLPSYLPLCRRGCKGTGGGHQGARPPGGGGCPGRMPPLKPFLLPLQGC